MAPVAVLLHGFLGSAADWHELQGCWRYPTLALDLPGHGANPHEVMDFAAVDAWLVAELNARAITDYVLLGYSLGGRVALYHASHNPIGLKGLILENAHPGLADPLLQQARAANDARWSARFDAEPLEAVLADWYRQAVFADLTLEQRQSLQVLRRQNDPHRLARMLRATSLSVQPDLRPWIQTTPLPLWYVSGQADTKFQALGAALAQEYGVTHVSLAGGHNLHHFHAVAVAAALEAAGFYLP